MKILKRILLILLTLLAIFIIISLFNRPALPDRIVITYRFQNIDTDSEKKIDALEAKNLEVPKDLYSKYRKSFRPITQDVTIESPEQIKDIMDEVSWFPCLPLPIVTGHPPMKLVGYIGEEKLWHISVHGDMVLWYYGVKVTNLYDRLLEKYPRPPLPVSNQNEEKKSAEINEKPLQR